MAKLTCKIVCIPRNGKIEVIVTCSMADSIGSCHQLMPSSSEEITPRTLPMSKTTPAMTRQPKGLVEILHISSSPLKSKRSWLNLHGWRRLSEIAQTVRCRLQKHRRWWPDNPNYWKGLQNLCLRDSIKPLEIHFLAAGCHHIDVFT